MMMMITYFFSLSLLCLIDLSSMYVCVFTQADEGQDRIKEGRGEWRQEAKEHVIFLFQKVRRPMRREGVPKPRPAEMVLRQMPRYSK